MESKQGKELLRDCYNEAKLRVLYGYADAHAAILYRAGNAILEQTDEDRLKKEALRRDSRKFDNLAWAILALIGGEP